MYYGASSFDEVKIVVIEQSTSFRMFTITRKSVKMGNPQPSPLKEEYIVW